MPEGYRECPPVDDFTEYMLRAYFIMSPSRKRNETNGYPMAVSLSVIQSYDSIYGIIGDAAEFTEIVSKMDEGYIPVMIRRIKSKSGAMKPPPSGAITSRDKMPPVSPPTSKQVR